MKIKLIVDSFKPVSNNPADTGGKLNVNETFNLRPVSTGKAGSSSPFNTAAIGYFDVLLL